MDHITAGTSTVPGTVIALHCSGADGRQWRRLRAELGAGYSVQCPDLIGACDNAWNGQHAFTLADEVHPILGLIDAAADGVHLVGHSYGGAVALKAACARPERIASLTLYEPIPFQILRELGARADRELAEVEALATLVAAGLLSGTYEYAAIAFAEDWGGSGGWDALRPAAQAALLRWLPKAPLDFRATLHDTARLADFATVACPVLVMQGALANAPCRTLAQELARSVPHCALEVLPGAGHMGPATHANAVITEFAAHIRAATHGAAWPRATAFAA